MSGLPERLSDDDVEFALESGVYSRRLLAAEVAASRRAVKAIRAMSVYVDDAKTFGMNEMLNDVLAAIDKEGL